MTKTAFVAGMILATLGACSSEAGGGAPTPGRVSTKLPDAAPRASFDDRVIAKVDMSYPDELVETAGSVWVKTDDGRVVEVDSATNRIVGQVKVDTSTDPYHYCQGLGVDAESVWACSASGGEDSRSVDVVRIDPRTRAVVATVKVGKIRDQFQMPVVENRIWVLTGEGTRIVGIDTESNRIASEIDLDVSCSQVSEFGSSLLAACTEAGVVLQIDVRKGEVSRRASFDDPRNVAATADAVWIVQTNSLVRADPRTLKPVLSFASLTEVGTDGGVAVSNDAVWARLGNGSLYRIDPVRNEVVEKVETARDLSGGSVLIAAGAVWTTDSDGSLLLRLRTV